MNAAGGGRLEVLRLLLERGADVAHADKTGTTALMFASKEWPRDRRDRADEASWKAIVRLLLERGADVAHADDFGWTALIHASSGGHEATAQLLLARNAYVAGRRRRPSIDEGSTVTRQGAAQPRRASSAAPARRPLAVGCSYRSPSFGPR